jgi:hypothetical protein
MALRFRRCFSVARGDRGCLLLNPLDVFYDFHHYVSALSSSAFLEGFYWYAIPMIPPQTPTPICLLLIPTYRLFLHPKPPRRPLPEPL